MFKFRKKSHQEVLDNIPNHIGIIMDGNGRWAKKRLQPRVMGHKAGMDAHLVGTGNLFFVPW